MLFESLADSGRLVSQLFASGPRGSGDALVLTGTGKSLLEIILKLASGTERVSTLCRLVPSEYLKFLERKKSCRPHRKSTKQL